MCNYSVYKILSDGNYIYNYFLIILKQYILLYISKILLSENRFYLETIRLLENDDNMRLVKENKLI